MKNAVSSAWRVARGAALSAALTGSVSAAPDTPSPERVFEGLRVRVAELVSRTVPEAAARSVASADRAPALAARRDAESLRHDIARFQALNRETYGSEAPRGGEVAALLREFGGANVILGRAQVEAGAKSDEIAARRAGARTENYVSAETGDGRNG